MININTIISSFDEEGTLLKWLKKVEDALKNASLKTVETVTIDDTSFQLKFVFADDTFLLSPTITSPKAGLLDNATLEVKKASDGDPVINLVAEFGDKSKVNSPAKFDSNYFDIRHERITLIDNFLYQHEITITKGAKAAIIHVLSFLNYEFTDFAELRDMINNKEFSWYRGTLRDTGNGYSLYNVGDVRITANMIFISYWTNASNTPSEVQFDSTSTITDIVNRVR